MKPRDSEPEFFQVTGVMVWYGGDGVGDDDGCDGMLWW